ncbi:hypothetical protein VST7929_01558 [Vibrio stylophorae]|uniref:Class I SAM-dependent methyltransferase n=1 Tax=Vibrio stylophorae TaxID=659351 RepID=A0ABN8DUS7_9VIBR|nr:class I SAM-dependent methyltransferase [Vibrio stylophorae]CAH0533685.1 hypothetical protein VST7929_01558 [Vibrio stylophorae]
MTLQDEVAKTLLIPLYMKAKESRRTNAFFDDPTACEVVEKVPYDLSIYENAIRSQVGCALRANYFDQLAIDFIQQNPLGVLVNLGCGLDARYQRISKQIELPDTLFLYDLDLPEVMAFRAELIPSSTQNPSLSGSLFDKEWIDTLFHRHGDVPVLFIIEGVFMYFDKTEVANAIRQMTLPFSQSDIAFDSSSSFMCKHSSRHDTVKHTNARFKFALDDPKEVESWQPNLKLVSMKRYNEFSQWRLTGRLNCWMMALIPALKNASRLLHYRCHA